MARKFDELRAAMSPDAQERVRLKTAKLRDELPLHELRQAHGLSQSEIATALDVKQPSVAKMEKNVDMYISTLRGYIRAMGGRLNISAVFPEGEVVITNFVDIDNPRGSLTGRRIKVRKYTTYHGHARKVSDAKMIRVASGLRASATSKY